MNKFRLITAGFILGTSIFVALIFKDKKHFGLIELTVIGVLFIIYLSIVFLMWKKIK